MEGKILLTFDGSGAIDIEVDVHGVNALEKMNALDSFCRGLRIDDNLLQMYMVCKARGLLEHTTVDMGLIEEQYGKGK